MEVVHHDLGFEADGVVVALDIAAQLLRRFLGVELRVVFGLLNQLVVAVHGRVGLEHVEDEALLDGLFHGVSVEGPVADLALGVGRQGFAEHLQRFVPGGSGEREIVGVGQHFARRQRFSSASLTVSSGSAPVSSVPGGIDPPLREIAALPLEKRYVWRVASALKWGFADFDDWNVAVDRKTPQPEDFDELMKLLRFRPIQFCLFLRALVGAEEMERLMNEGIATAKQEG